MGRALSRVTRAPSTVALVLLTAVGPLAIDMYVPGLPAISDDLHARTAAAQLSLTAFLIGIAVGQLLFGPLSDGTGRRVFLLTGPAVFAATSLVCAFSTNIITLDLFRLGQGLAGAAGLVAARAAVSDYFSPTDAARRFAIIGSLVGIAPVVAPVLGGLILTIGVWRDVFFVLTAVGVLLFVAALVGVPETLPPERRSGSSLGETHRRILDLLRDRRFMGFVVTGSLVTAAIFAYVVSSTFVMQQVYGLSAEQYTLFFAVNSVCLVVGGLIFRQLVGRVRVRTLLLFGLSLSSGAIVAAVIAQVIGGTPPLWLIWSLLALVLGGMGFNNPSFVTLSQRAGARAPGTAAALQGGFQFLIGAALTPLGGLFGVSSPAPMLFLIAAFLVAALLANRLQSVLQRESLRELD